MDFVNSGSTTSKKNPSFFFYLDMLQMLHIYIINALNDGNVAAVQYNIVQHIFELNSKDDTDRFLNQIHKS